MSRSQFRWLLVGYLAVVVLTILSDTMSASLIPKAVKELEASLQAQSPPSLLLLALMVATLCAGLIGFIGMFCFWPLSRRIYLIAIFLKILASPLIMSWKVETGWESLFGELELFLDGVILTLCLAGPAKRLFDKQQESNNAMNRTSNHA